MPTFGGGGAACTVCEKTAYPAETISFDKKPYHIDCFRCAGLEDAPCNKKLGSSGKGQGYEGKIYCATCFKTGGFAAKQRSTKWTPSATTSTSKSKFGGGGTPCTVCNKSVYPAETVSFDKKPFHQSCFKCTWEKPGGVCGLKLTPSKAAIFDGKLYCHKCFKDSGCSAEQRKVKWEKKETTGAASSKFGGGGKKCYKCTKTVYDAEALSYEKHLYHAKCFRCLDCNTKFPKVKDAKYINLDEFGVCLYCTKCWIAGDFGSAAGRDKAMAHEQKRKDEAEGGATEAKAEAEPEPVAEDPPAEEEAAVEEPEAEADPEKEEAE